MLNPIAAAMKTIDGDPATYAAAADIARLQSSLSARRDLGLIHPDFDIAAVGRRATTLAQYLLAQDDARFRDAEKGTKLREDHYKTQVFGVKNPLPTDALEQRYSYDDHGVWIAVKVLIDPSAEHPTIKATVELANAVAGVEGNTYADVYARRRAQHRINKLLAAN